MNKRALPSNVRGLTRQEVAALDRLLRQLDGYDESAALEFIKMAGLTAEYHGITFRDMKGRPKTTRVAFLGDRKERRSGIVRTVTDLEKKWSRLDNISQAMLGVLLCLCAKSPKDGFNAQELLEELTIGTRFSTFAELAILQDIERLPQPVDRPTSIRRQFLEMLNLHGGNAVVGEFISLLSQVVNDPWVQKRLGDRPISPEHRTDYQVRFVRDILLLLESRGSLTTSSHCLNTISASVCECALRAMRRHAKMEPAGKVAPPNWRRIYKAAFRMLIV